MDDKPGWIKLFGWEMNQPPLTPLPRQLGGVELGAPASTVEEDETFRELSRLEAAPWNGGMGECWFSRPTESGQLLCSLLAGHVVAVGHARQDVTLGEVNAEYMQRYGEPAMRNDVGWPTWLDEHTFLEVFERVGNVVVMVHDGELLAEHFRRLGLSEEGQA